MGKVFIKAKQQFFKPGESQMYFTKSITYSKIGFDVLVKHVSADSGMSEAACEGAIRSIMKQVEEMVLLFIIDVHLEPLCYFTIRSRKCLMKRIILWFQQN